MKVVCNSSPLVNLSRIGRLYILKQLYTELLIPEAVYQEVVINGEGMPGAYEVSCSDWITTRDIKDQRLVRVLSYDLDLGESEAIVLAIQENAELLVMDERIGREMARHLDLLFTGTIGALIEAKRKSVIDKILPILEELRDKAGFRISASLFKHVLDVAGERPVE